MRRALALAWRCHHTSTSRRLSVMNKAPESEAHAACQQYQALFAIAESIVAHRDLKALLHDLASHLRQVVPFDGLALVRHDAEKNLMHRHVFDHANPLPAEAPLAFAVEDDPGGQVLHTQQPLIFSKLEDA